MIYPVVLLFDVFCFQTQYEQTNQLNNVNS